MIQTEISRTVIRSTQPSNHIQLCFLWVIWNRTQGGGGWDLLFCFLIKLTSQTMLIKPMQHCTRNIFSISNSFSQILIRTANTYEKRFDGCRIWTQGILVTLTNLHQKRNFLLFFETGATPHCSPPATERRPQVSSSASEQTVQGRRLLWRWEWRGWWWARISDNSTSSSGGWNQGRRDKKWVKFNWHRMIPISKEKLSS